MIGIYNTIALDGQNTGKRDERSLAYNATESVTTSQYAKLVEAVVTFLGTQSGTPSPDSRVAISGRSSAGFYFNSSAKTLSFGSTYYGGILDYMTGKLTITHKLYRLSSSLTWTTTGTASYSYRYRAQISEMAASGDKKNADNCKCTHLTWSGTYGYDWGTFYCDGTYVYVNDKSGHFASLADFMAWLDSFTSSSTYVQLMYPLATPIVSYITAGSPLQCRAGTNAITAHYGALDYVIVEPYTVLKRPSDFEIQRQDIYAGEYTTCTGSVKADRIGWKYADMTLTFDELTTDELNILSGMYGAITLSFEDSDGTHDEQVIKTAFTNTPTRFTLPDGSVIWKDAGVSLRFIDAHS